MFPFCLCHKVDIVLEDSFSLSNSNINHFALNHFIGLLTNFRDIFPINY
jgi:hypothetical protein